MRVEYSVERHERHIVLWLAGRRWVLRDETELQLMLRVFGFAGGQDVRDRACRALPLWSMHSLRSRTEQPEH